MARIQTVLLPKPWLSMQLLTVDERTVTDTEVSYQHHLYLVDAKAENGLLRLDSRPGAVFPREMQDKPEDLA